MTTEILQLRAIAQMALTTHITPRVRSISMSLDSSGREIGFRVYTDGALPESAAEALNCALTEIHADYPLGQILRINEEFIVAPEPEPMHHLPIVVYVRCEDPWVDRT
jgi:predicted trehalose synthase